METGQVELTFDRALHWLDDMDGRPRFLFMQTFQVHAPYTPPAAYRDLFAGDRLFIPDKQTKTESVATEQRHRFQVKGGSLLLRIVLKDIDDEPIAQAACALEVDGAEHFLTTDANGLIEQAIPGTAERGTLTIDDPDVLLDIEGLRIGHLDPVDTPSGQQARLNNLGYYIDTADRPEEEELRSAVEEFQCDHGLTVDGDCGPNTQAKLTEVHGC